MSNYGFKKKYSLPRTVHVHILEDRAIGWFNGASQQFGEQSGAGGMIKLAITLPFSGLSTVVEEQTLGLNFWGLGPL